MGLIAAEGPLRPSAIAKKLDMTASAVSRHLTALQDSGRITVDSDPTDDRTFLVRIASQGSAEMAAAVGAGTDWFVAVVAHWSDHDIAEAARLVQKLLDSWAQPAPTPPATASGPHRSGPHRRRRARTAEGNMS